jgi:hypothetical protein
VPLDLFLDIDFEDGEFFVDRIGVVGFFLKKADLEIKGVGQTVRRIHAHHQRPVIQARQMQAGSRGKTGLPHASFAAEEKDAHASIVNVPVIIQRIDSR